MPHALAKQAYDIISIFKCTFDESLKENKGNHLLARIRKRFLCVIRRERLGFKRQILNDGAYALFVEEIVIAFYRTIYPRRFGLQAASSHQAGQHRPIVRLRHLSTRGLPERLGLGQTKPFAGKGIRVPLRILQHLLVHGVRMEPRMGGQTRV